MTAPAAPPVEGSRAEGSRAGVARARALAWSALRRAGLVVVAAAVSLLVLRYVLPSRLEGARGGLTGALSWVVDQHPLFVGLLVFVGLTEIGRYWWRQLAPSSARLAAVDTAFSWLGARRLLIGLAVAGSLAYVVRSSVVASYRVVGPSMLPTLEVGDRLLVSRSAYGTRLPLSKKLLHARVPARGDLVVFPASGLTGAPGAQAVVKRVIGLPGDTMSFDQGRLLINGWAVPTCDAGPYANLLGRLTVKGRLDVEFLGDKAYLTIRKPVERSFAEYTVKPNEVFVVGDDRGLSSDSRFWDEGRGAGVPIDMLEGKVTRVLLGARPDGRLDASRLLSPPLDLKVRMPGFDTRETDKRIANCLARRPAVTSPPAAPPQWPRPQG
jgi:signal peptidase I